MIRAARRLSLTPAHVAFVHRQVEETPPLPDLHRATDREFAEWTRQVLASDPDPPGRLRLFVYGSLIWKPEVAHESEEPATLHGWHRSFCIRLSGFRGTPEEPGLMMALDRGGACRGMIFTLPAGDKAMQIHKLLRRELPFAPPGNLPGWLQARTGRGPVPTLAFIANRRSPRYAGRLSVETVADVLARACGYAGTGADYLLQTVSHLEARGIRDSLLWTLQDMVAARIDTAMRDQPRPR